MLGEQIKRKRILNEEKQEENALVNLLLERQMEEYGQLSARERLQNERILTYFYGQKEFSFFEDTAEDAYIEEQRFYEEIITGQETLSRERRQLEERAEALYEEELQAVREEEKTNGEDGNK